MSSFTGGYGHKEKMTFLLSIDQQIKLFEQETNWLVDLDSLLNKSNDALENIF